MNGDNIEDILVKYYSRAGDGLCDHEDDLLRFAAKDMDRREAREFRRHLTGCERCRAELERFKALDLSSWEVPEQAASSSRWWSWGRRLAPVVAAAAAAVLLALWLPEKQVKDRPATDPLQPKGAWKVTVAANRQGQVFVVNDRARLETGDRLGFFFTGSRSGYLLIMYLDQQGDALRIYPATDRPTRTPAGSGVRLPDGAVLSDGDRCEWIVSLFSQGPISESSVKRALTRMWRKRSSCRLAFHKGKGPLPEGVDYRVLTVYR